MLRYFRSISADTKDRGASAVEYGLMVAAIAAVIVAVVFGLGGLVQGAFDRTCDNIATNDRNDSTTTAQCDTPAP